MTNRQAEVRTLICGVVGLAFIAGAAATSWSVYSGALRSTIPVVVEADRAGLLLDPGSDVRVDGLPVGRVESVRLGDRGVDVSIALGKDQARRIGTNTTASIEATTTFGAKYVALKNWRRHGGPALSRDAHLRATSITTETNDLFEQVQEVTTIVQPSELNAALDGVARALDGRGETLGQLIATGDDYLRALDPHLAALSADLELAPDVIETYRVVAPDLLSTGANVARTADLLVDQQGELAATLDGIARASVAGNELVRSIAVPLASWLQVLRPFSANVLARYARVLPCLLKGMDRHQHDVSMSLGKAQPGYQGVLSFLPAQQGYQYPRDLPKIMPPGKADCRGLPEPRTAKPPRLVFDDGTHVFGDDVGLSFNPLPTIYKELFGLPPAVTSP